MKFAVTSLAAFAFAATASVATAKEINKFDDTLIDSVLKAVAATNIEKQTSPQGDYRVFEANGLKFVIASRVCKPETGCLGLLIQCSFTGETFSTTSANTFNLNHVFGNAAVSDDRKTIYLGRYMIADGGTTQGNVVENMKVFFSLPAQLIEQIKAEGTAPIAAVQPSTTPVAATAPAAAAVASTAPAASVAITAAPAKASDWVQGHANTLSR